MMRFPLIPVSYGDDPAPAAGGVTPKGMTAVTYDTPPPADVDTRRGRKGFIIDGPGVAPPTPPWLRQQILERDARGPSLWQCYICGGWLADASMIDVDHVVPRQGLWRRGGTTPSNLRVACVPCNRSKSNR